MSQHSFHVLIIGGGLGGLCLAQGLKKAGISVAVYERDRTRNERLQGYRIHIEAMGNRALHDCLPPHLFEAYLKTTGSDGKGLLMAPDCSDHDRRLASHAATPGQLDRAKHGHRDPVAHRHSRCALGELAHHLDRRRYSQHASDTRDRRQYRPQRCPIALPEAGSGGPSRENAVSGAQGVWNRHAPLQFCRR